MRINFDIERERSSELYKEITNDTIVDILADTTINYKIKLPSCPEYLYPLIAVLPMQLLSYHTSVALGYNPDKPRNLAKSVTVE